LRSAIIRCTPSEAWTALKALGNSSSSPSPLLLTMRPPSSKKIGSIASMLFQRGGGARFIGTGQSVVADDIR
jgi:hypothetical protein